MAERSWREARVEEFAAALAGPDPMPAAGAAAAAACAFAAGLVELTAGDDGPAREAAARLRQRALELIDLDVRAYERLLAESGSASSEQARRDVSAPPLEIAETAVAVIDLARDAIQRATGPRSGDAAAAVEVATGACRAAISLVEANLGATGGEPQLARAQTLADRISTAPS